MKLPRVVLNLLTLARFPGSAKYWDLRYRTGGDSGQGSYGAEFRYKTDFLNTLIERRQIRSVIDFGCGDGHQIRELRAPQYTGVDVSAAAIERCRALYCDDPTRTFVTLAQYEGQTADAAMSLDVLYHLVEDAVFEAYIDRLFIAARRFVVVYATNYDDDRNFRGAHVKHRRFTERVRTRHPQFALVDSPPRPQELGGIEAKRASFFVFERSDAQAT